MYLPNDCRVITIGDGDLSFSRSLLSHLKPANLIASTYDSAEVLTNKYTRNALYDLQSQGVKTRHSVDITDLSTIPSEMLGFADIVIFNHPLVPTQKSFAQYQKQRDKTANLLNRDLLYCFLQNCFAHLLRPEGERLCYITTKSVKPYSHWHLETSLTIGAQTLESDMTSSPIERGEYQYLGNEPFDISMFKQYQVRNVDRDKCVKHEASDVYVYSDNLNHPISARLLPFKYNQKGYCPLCRKGPFANESDWALHQQTRIHKAQADYHQAWVDHLVSKYQVSIG